MASALILLSLGGCFSSVDWTLLVTDERCDGKDNDLDGAVDEGLPQYADADGDGFGDPANVVGCEGEAVVDGGDCDDGDAEVFPGAKELCDNVDDDCDEAVDEGLPQYADADGDTFGDPANILGCEGDAGAVVVDGSDCDDRNSDVYQGAEELCDALDNDCDESVDEGLPQTIFYADSDGDTFGNVSASMEACVAPNDAVHDDSDCDDSAASVYPGAPEICGDGSVNDCEKTVNDVRVDCAMGEMNLGLADGILTGEDSRDEAGWSVSSAGDMNNDGVGDLLVSAPRNDWNGSEAGSVFIVYGPYSGVTSLVTADVVVVGESEEDSFGHAAGGSGDVNDDGYHDLLIGAPDNDRGGREAGAAYLIQGPINGIIEAADSDAIIIGGSANEISGWAVAWAGDINGDDRSDILVGVPTNTHSSGAAFLFTSTVNGEVTLDSADGAIVGDSNLQSAGYALAGAGDTNADGFSDIVVGSEISNAAIQRCSPPLIGLALCVLPCDLA